MNELKKQVNPLKVRQLNHTLSWSISGLIVCGGLSIMFMLMRLVYPATIMVVGTLISFTLIWKETKLVKKNIGGK